MNIEFQRKENLANIRAIGYYARLLTVLGVKQQRVFTITVPLQ